MRDQIAAKLKGLLDKLDAYERARFSGYADVFNDYFLVAGNDTMTPFHARAIADFIRGSAKDLNDAELIGLCDRIERRAQHILQLEDESDEAWEAEKAQSYWEEKEYFSATDIGIQLNISHSGAKVNKVLASFGLQERVNGGWVATAKAKGLAIQHGLEEGQKPYIQWEKAIIRYLTEALQ